MSDPHTLNIYFGTWSIEVQVNVLVDSRQNCMAEGHGRGKVLSDVAAGSRAGWSEHRDPLPGYTNSDPHLLTRLHLLVSHSVTNTHQ